MQELQTADDLSRVEPGETDGRELSAARLSFELWPSPLVKLAA